MVQLWRQVYWSEGLCMSLKNIVFHPGIKMSKERFRKHSSFLMFFWCFFPMLFITWMTSQVLNLRSLLILSHRHFPLLFTEFYRSSEFGTVSRYDSSESSEDTFPSCAYCRDTDTLGISHKTWHVLVQEGIYSFRGATTLNSTPGFLPLTDVYV